MTAPKDTKQTKNAKYRQKKNTFTPNNNIADGILQVISISEINNVRCNVLETSDKLKHDEATLRINSTLPFPVGFYSQTDNCWKCPLLFEVEVAAMGEAVHIVKTIFPTTIVFRRASPESDGQQDVCRFYETFRERGEYWIHLREELDMSWDCQLTIKNNPLPAEMPIVYVFLGLLFMSVMYKLGENSYRRIRERNSEINPVTTKSSDCDHHITVPTDDEQTQAEQNAGSKKERLKSLDTFRGISLAVMMFVNYGGGGYWFFEHPSWNGLTVADLVFPWFVFIMGTAMNYSFRSMIRRGVYKSKILVKIIKRSLKLFALGIILNTNWGPVDLNFIRIMGVLQRFSLTYLVLGLIELAFYKEAGTHKEKRWSSVADVIMYFPQWLICSLLLALHVILTFMLPVPGCPTGYVGPGGLSEGGKYFNCTGGAAQYIDRSVFTQNHMYQGSQGTYQTAIPFEPEGLLGTLTSVFLCFLGLQAGRILMFHEKHSSRIIRWVIWAIICGSIATVLCKGSQNDGWIPVNKALWSVSFLLVTGSFAFIVLAVLYVVMDVHHLWNGAPFIYPGMNSIVVYCCHSFFYRFFPVRWQIEEVHWALLLQSVWSTAIWMVLSYILFRKRIFIAL
ncbi:hypothetical protein ScPMuIL_015897 [Solemya velum]